MTTLPILPYLSTHIAAQLKKLGLSQLAAATKIGVTHNILRQDLSRNQFYSEDLLALCNLVGFDTDPNRLAAAYSFRIKTQVRTRIHIQRTVSESPSSLIDQCTQLVRSALIPSDILLSRLLQVSRDNTLLTIFISEHLPSHWGSQHSESKVLAHLLEAIRRGSHIVYLYPGEDARSQILHINPRVLGSEYVEQGFYRLHRRLRSQCSRTDLDEHLILLPHNNPILCTPCTDRLFVAEGGSIFGTSTIPIKGKTLRYSDYPFFQISDAETLMLVNTFEDTIASAYSKKSDSPNPMFPILMHKCLGIV